MQVTAHAHQSPWRVMNASWKPESAPVQHPRCQVPCQVRYSPPGVTSNLLSLGRQLYSPLDERRCVRGTMNRPKYQAGQNSEARFDVGVTVTVAAHLAAHGVASRFAGTCTSTQDTAMMASLGPCFQAPNMLRTCVTAAVGQQWQVSGVGKGGGAGAIQTPSLC